MKSINFIMIPCLILLNSVMPAYSAGTNISPQDFDAKKGRLEYELTGYPDGIDRLSFIDTLARTTLAEDFWAAVIKYRYLEADNPVPFNYTGQWTEHNSISLSETKTSFTYGFEPLDSFTQAYFSENSAFKRKKLLDEIPALEEKIKQIHDFNLGDHNRFIVPLMIKGVGQFDFNTMSKDFVFNNLHCNKDTKTVSIDFDKSVGGTMYGSSDERMVPIKHAYLGFPYSISDKVSVYKRDCMLTMPLNDENIAEQIDVATADGKIVVWAVVDVSNQVKWGQPTGRVEQIVFSKWKDNPKKLTFITSLKAKSDEPVPSFTTYLSDLNINSTRRKLEDPKSPKAVNYRTVMKLFRNTAGKIFYDASNGSANNKKARTRTVFVSVNPDTGLLELLFFGANKSNEQFLSLVDYEFVEMKDGMLTAVLKHVITGGNNNIPNLLVFDTFGGVNSPYLTIDYMCNYYKCGSTNFDLRKNGFSYKQFKGWRDTAVGKQSML